MSATSQSSRAIPKEALHSKIQGVNLNGTTLEENLKGPTVLAFLRHFG